MSLTNISKDPAELTMTVDSEWDAPLSRVWQLWADPRKLERWWGPPTYPATVVEHELRPGGRVTYFMTSPEGERYHGWWKVVAVEEARRLDFEDGFADSDGTPNEAMPTTQSIVTLTELAGGGTQMRIHSRFPSREAMDQMIEMGMEEGLTGAIGQIDSILAAA